ncbi:hypothetical protein BDP67DRAFT_622668 [Colletotrichum lupini]|nr:hypothetical protein BDP67DRAFT_622668 [Colletotrichum lupini]
MSTKATSLSAEEILRHPAYKTTQWDLKPRLSGFATVAESRPGGPFPMWYEVHGRGPKKIVWIMGLGGSRNLWKRQNRHFGHLRGEEYSSLVFDNRGVSKSAKPNCRYSTLDMAKDLVELLRHIGWLKTDSHYYPRDLNIAGISLGGMIAQELALLIPQRLQSLILISTAPRLIRTVHTFEHMKQRVAMFLPTAVDVELKNKASRLFTRSYLNAPDTGSLDPEKTFPTNLDRFVAEELAERCEDTDFSRRKGVVLQAIAAGWHHKSDADLARIGDEVGRTRILVMHGTFDETITFPHFELIKAALGDGPEYIAWKDCGHVPLWEREEEFNETVGNGDFAFNFDITGTQSLVPFNTLSSWGWHKDALPQNGEKLEEYAGVPVVTHGREVVYDLEDPKLPEISKWLSANPNRINLGRISLSYKNETLSSITEPRQVLDLWNGVTTSSFKVDGEDVKVVTQGDFDTESVTFDIESVLIFEGTLRVEFDFPFPPIHKVEKTSDFEVFMGSYQFPDNHTTSIIKPGVDSDDTAHIHHTMQETSYYQNLRWPKETPLTLRRIGKQDSNTTNAHRYGLFPAASGKNVTRANGVSFTAQYNLKLQRPSLPSSIRRRNSLDWQRYWKEGGFVDLTQSSNPNATELQRRIILSQYAMRINSAATGQPPQESGLVYNGWWGKFHMEMVVWHCAHWATWGRSKYFDRIFPAVYEDLLPSAEARARRMGWDGARWPKMTELVTKGIAPGETRAYLQWQQPHPIYLAELAYKANQSRETLQRWDRTITSTAQYMASFAWFNNASGKYDLGPPIQGVTENSSPTEISNLAYELAYWQWALNAACNWKKRLEQDCPSAWSRVAQNMASPPEYDGLFAPWIGGGVNASWWDNPQLNKDPRSVIMLQGMVPDTPLVNAEVGVRTADKVWDVWGDAQIRGWGRNVLAINSARIGNPERAIYHLTNFGYWTFGDQGFAHRSGPSE